MNKLRAIDYPKIGKAFIILTTTIEGSVYSYLAISSTSNIALGLSLYLLFTSINTLLLTALSISVSFYYRHSKSYCCLGGLAILSRFVSMILLSKLNNAPS